MQFTNWFRPVSELPNQVALGMNFVIGYESGGIGGPYTREQYKSACQALGLKYLLQGPPDDATLAAEAADPFCIGWDQPDEPNAGQPSTIPVSILQANYAKWKAAAPNKIVLLNLDGNQQESWNPTWSYADAAKCCDLLMFDYYVRNRNGMGPPSLKAQFEPIIQRFKGYCQNGQKFGYFVETDNQLLSEQGWAPNGCGPTNQDVQDYFDLAKQYNVDVVGLFEDVIGKGWVSFDSTTPAMYALIKQNIAALSGGNPPPVINPIQRVANGVNFSHGSVTISYNDGSQTIL